GREVAAGRGEALGGGRLASARAARAQRVGGRTEQARDELARRRARLSGGGGRGRAFTPDPVDAPEEDGDGQAGRQRDEDGNELAAQASDLAQAPSPACGRGIWGEGWRKATRARKATGRRPGPSAA